MKSFLKIHIGFSYYVNSSLEFVAHFHYVISFGNQTNNFVQILCHKFPLLKPVVAPNFLIDVALNFLGIFFIFLILIDHNTRAISRLIFCELF